MKVAYFSEGAADEAAIRALTEAVLGHPTEPVIAPIRSRGWPSVRNLLPAIILHLHYHTDADGLVVVADSNNTLIDTAGPATGMATHESCRLVQLCRAAAATVVTLRPRPDRPPLKIAVGLAVPAIEAWLLCGADPNVSEAAYTRGLREGRTPYQKNELKRRAYGSDRTSEAIRTAKSIEHATRLAQDLGSLERLFPYGFGALADAVRKW